MNVYIYPTDRNWYGFLRDRPEIDEVNFWRPGGKQAFQQLNPGDLFLFRIGAPDNAIAGGGTYTHFSFASVLQAWEAFGAKNGTPDYETFLRLLARHRNLEGSSEQIDAATIGCIILTAPFFLPRDRWVAIPADYPVTAAQGYKYDASVGTGKFLIDAVRDALPYRRVSEASAEEMRFGISVVRRRLGQGGFSFIVADAYEKRCAVTGERTVPVLEAAHIMPVKKGGLHRPDNGLFLRSDIHKLFDHGYVTVQPDGMFRVSSKLKDNWQNGRVYYDLDRTSIRLPRATDRRPGLEFLEWHNETVFKR